jgi:hypothetical protein
MDNNYIKAKFISFLGKRCICGACFNINYTKRSCFGIKNLIEGRAIKQRNSKYTFPSIAWGLSFKDYTSLGTNLKRNPNHEKASIVHPFLTLIESNEYIIRCPKCGTRIVKEISDSYAQSSMLIIGK